jgi:hypothetical protein
MMTLIRDPLFASSLFFFELPLPHHGPHQNESSTNQTKLLLPTIKKLRPRLYLLRGSSEQGLLKARARRGRSAAAAIDDDVVRTAADEIKLLAQQRRAAAQEHYHTTLHSSSSSTTSLTNDQTKYAGPFGEQDTDLCIDRSNSTTRLISIFFFHAHTHRSNGCSCCWGRPRRHAGGPDAGARRKRGGPRPRGGGGEAPGGDEVRGGGSAPSLMPFSSLSKPQHAHTHTNIFSKPDRPQAWASLGRALACLGAGVVAFLACTLLVLHHVPMPASDAPPALQGAAKAQIACPDPVVIDLWPRGEVPLARPDLYKMGQAPYLKVYTPQGGACAIHFPVPFE